jgi:hypothetical protein
MKSKCLVHHENVNVHLIGNRSISSETSNLEKSSTKNTEFGRLLLEAVDESFSSLGDSAKHAIYFYLAENFKICQRDIPGRIEDFSNAIEEIFGLGSKLLEIQILRRLHSKVGSDLRHYSREGCLSFVDFVEAYRASLDVSNCSRFAAKTHVEI